MKHNLKISIIVIFEKEGVGCYQITESPQVTKTQKIFFHHIQLIHLVYVEFERQML